jgi:cytochrome P460
MSIRRFTTRSLLIAALVMGIAGVTGLALRASAQSGPAWGPEWTAAGDLVLPRGYHAWVFLGSPLTPNALNEGQAGFPEYHNVYVQSEPLEIYRETGEWPEGTILLKELQLTLPSENPDGSRHEASGRGFFPGPRNGIDISVKDSARFKDTNGWGFFNFGHHAPPYAKTAAVQPEEACAGCHIANATQMVFSKFYAPILNAN